MIICCYALSPLLTKLLLLPFLFLLSEPPSIIMTSTFLTQVGFCRGDNWKRDEPSKISWTLPLLHPPLPVMSISSSLSSSGCFYHADHQHYRTLWQLDGCSCSWRLFTHTLPPSRLPVLSSSLLYSLPIKQVLWSLKNEIWEGGIMGFCLLWQELSTSWCGKGVPTTTSYLFNFFTQPNSIVWDNCRSLS